MELNKVLVSGILILVVGIVLSFTISDFSANYNKTVEQNITFVSQANETVTKLNETMVTIKTTNPFENLPIFGWFLQGMKIIWAGLTIVWTMLTLFMSFMNDLFVLLHIPNAIAFVLQAMVYVTIIIVILRALSGRI